MQETHERSLAEPDTQSARAPLYRRDIDGLRAVAVIAVVAYHAFPNVVRGGLVGVDIFFVISGFLITTLILEGLVSKRFSFVDFYTRRVRRIFPALALVLGSCLVAGWFLLYDVEYLPLGKHVAAGAGFISNFALARESGYFDSQAGYKELLHLWSLGVEEQFYLLFPLILALCWKKVSRALPIILTILASSLALNLWMIHRQPSDTFYLPATRFWELMLGAVLAYAMIAARIRPVRVDPEVESASSPPTLRRPITLELCSWIGVALVLTALLVVNDESAFPGWLALLPTLGALLIICGGPNTLINRRVLSSRPMVFIGLISYPLYLWHWPLLSFARVIGPENPGRLMRTALVIASVVLAWLTYRLIERPVRHFPKARPLALGLCAVMVCIGAAGGLLVYQQDGLPERAVNLRNASGHDMWIAAQAEDARIRNETFQTRPCQLPAAANIPEAWCAMYGPDTGETIVLWGDSHAEAWSPAFFRIADRRHLRVIRFSVGGCPPLVQTRRRDAVFAQAPCATFGQAERIVRVIATLKPSHIFLLARWSLYTPLKVATPDGAPQSQKDILHAQLARTLAALPRGTPVTVFRTAPVLRNDPSRALLRHTNVETVTSDYVHSEANANRAIDAVAALNPAVSVFDPRLILCSQRCGAIHGKTVVYANATHLSAQGAMLATEEIARRYFGAMVAHGEDELLTRGIVKSAPAAER
jgi:peptidoglycan/LPS O-acetylase OafA/YrhL